MRGRKDLEIRKAGPAVGKDRRSADGVPARGGNGAMPGRDGGGADLKSSDERYRAFIANSSEGIWRLELSEPIDTRLPTAEQIELIHKHAYLAECNDAFSRQYGHEKAADMLGTRLTDSLVPGDPMNTEFLRAFIESGYRLADAESHEKNAAGEDIFFLNNFVGLVEDGMLVRAWGMQREITERKRADGILERYRLISERAGDVIWLLRPDGRIVEVNQAASDLYGYSREELLSMNVGDLREPSTRGDLGRQLKRAAAGGVHFETVHLRKDGTPISIDVNANGGDFGGEHLILSIVRDISEKKRDEETLVQNQLMLSMAMQSSRMGVWERDIATGIITWSDELEEIFGLERGGFNRTEEHYRSLIHEDDREAVRTAVDRAVAEHRPYTIEFRFYRSDGGVRWMEGRGEAVYSQKGEPVRLYGVGIDITEEKLAERRLQDNERRMRELVEALPVAVYSTDAEGNITHYNEAAAEFAGRHAEIGKDKWCVTWRLYQPDGTFLPHDKCPMAVTLQTGEPVRGVEAVAERPDGTRVHFMPFPTPMRDADGKIVGAINVLVDITERKRNEEAIVERERLALLEAEVGEALIQNSGLPEILRSCTDTIVKHLDAAFARVWTLDESGKTLELQASSGLYTHLDGEHSRVPVGKFKIGRIAARRRPHLTNSVIDDKQISDREWARREGMVAFAGYPLLVEDRLVGVVAMFARRPLSMQTLAALASVSNILALGIQRKRTEKHRDELLTRETEARNEAETLNKLAEKLASELDLETLVQHVTDAATELCHAEFGAFFYNAANERGEAYQLYTLSGASREAFEKFGMPRITEIFEPTFAGTGVVRIDDVTKDQRYGKMAPHHGMPKGHLPVRSYLAVPVISRTGEVLGGLFFGHPTPDVFKESDERIIVGLAAHAAIAMDNAQLYAEAQKEIGQRRIAEDALRESKARLEAELAATKALQRVSSELIREDNTDALYEQIIDAAVAIMRADFASMQMFYPDRGSAGELKLLAFRGFDPRAAKFWEWVRADSGCTCGEALRTRRRAIATDVETCDFMAGTDDREAYLQAGMRAAQTTPLMSRTGKLLGMISTHWRAAHEPSDSDLRLLDVLARQAADLIERRASEEALQKSYAETERQRRLYDTILSNTPDLAYVFDLNRRFTYANAVLLEMWGTTLDEAIGKSCLELGYEPWHAEMHDREIDEVIATKQPIRGEVPFTGTFGRRIYDYIFVPIIGANGEVEAVAGSTRDVTDIKRRELNAAFLAAVSSDLGRLTDIAETMASVGGRIGEYFDASLVAFADIDEQADAAVVEHEWQRAGAASIIGAHRLSEFVTDEFRRAARAGHPIVCRDASRDTRVDAEHLAALDVGAFICIPLVRGEGAWRFQLAVYDSKARDWLEDEVELMRELTRRIWTRLERARAERALSQSEERYRSLVSVLTDVPWTADPEGAFIDMQPAWAEYTGQTWEDLRGFGWTDALHPDDRPKIQEIWERAAAAKSAYETDGRLWHAASRGYRYFVARAAPLLDAEGGVRQWVGTCTDIHERRLAEQQISGQNRTLEALAFGKELKEILALTTRSIEAVLPDSLVSVLLADAEEKHLFTGSADNLPDKYNAAIEGISIGEGIGSCGTSAFRREPVIVSDIARDPLWKDFRRLAETHNLAACWSHPILAPGGRLLGTFAVYFPKPRTASDEELSLLESAARVAGIAIQRKQTEEALHENERRFRAVFNHQFQFMVILAPDGTVVEVNEISFAGTGNAPDEVFGRKFWEMPWWTNLPEKQREWREIFERVSNGETRVTGEMRFQIATGELRDVSYSVSTIRGDAGEILNIIVEGNDITARKRAETRLVLVAEVSELARSISAPADLLYEVSKTVGEHLDVRRCLFNEIDLDRDLETVHRDYRRGVESVAGEHKISEYSPETSAEMALGRTVVNHDSATDPRTADLYHEAYEPHGERAYVAVPLLRDGKWVASLWVSDDVPRGWDEQEVSLLETVAERTWTAIEKLRSATALLESEERFSKAFKASPLVLTISSLETGKLIEVNETFVTATGYTREEAIGKTTVDLGVWKRVADRDAEWDTIHRIGELNNAEYTFLTKSGQEIVGLLSAERIEIGGRPFALTVIQDITERKRAQEALINAERKAAAEYQALLQRIVPLGETLGTARELETVYRSILEFVRSSMPCSAFFVSFFDAATRLRTAAFAWGEGGELDISRLPPIELTEDGGPNSRAVYEREPAVVNRYMDTMRGHPHVVVEDNGVDPQSSLAVPMIVSDRVLGTIEVQAYQEGAFTHEHVVALEMVANLAAVAIENVRLLEIEARARADAEAANQMKDEFLSILSHELRTPLNAMLGWIRMLRARILDEERTEKAFEVIERNTRQQSSLIEDLLDVSRIISGKMRIEKQLVDVAAIVHDAAETMRPLAAAGDAHFSVDIAPEPIFIDGDAVRLRQVFTNLLQNAIKFTPAGGMVAVLIRGEADAAVVTIRDTGVGIGSEFLPHIFDRFSQADASTRRTFAGLGLGLTIVKTIVELHGGTIEVDSDGPNLGAAFTVRLPFAKTVLRPDIHITAEGNGKPRSELAGVNILVVDDDAESIVPLQTFLSREAAVVTIASSAAEALEMLDGANFDILISDIGMPGKDGYEMLRDLRGGTARKNRSIPAIALTAYASNDDRDRALEAGYQAHVPKPLDFEKLFREIKSLRSKNSPKENGRKRDR